MYGSRLVHRDGNQTMTDIHQEGESSTPNTKTAQQRAKEFNSAMERERAQKRARKQTDGTEPPDFYDAAVAEGTQIMKNMEKAEWGRMRLGELAAKVEKEYGKNKLKQFAKDIGAVLCTLERSRSVYRAWAEIPAAPPNFSVAQELQDHPERAQIIKDKPNITTREARKKAQAWKEKKQKENPNFAVDQLKDWFKTLLARAGKAITDVDMVTEDPERRRNLKKAIKDPKLLDDLREGAKAWLTLADILQHVVDEQ
jgi:hypothetical protein